MRHAKPYTEVYQDLTHLLDPKITQIREKYDLPKIDTKIEAFLPEMGFSAGCAKPGAITLGIVPLIYGSIGHHVPGVITDFSKDVCWYWNYHGVCERELLGTTHELDKEQWYNCISLTRPSDSERDQNLVRGRFPEISKWIKRNLKKIKNLEYTFIHESAHVESYASSDLPLDAWRSALEPFCAGGYQRPVADDIKKAVELDVKVTPILEGFAIGKACKTLGLSKPQFIRIVGNEELSQCHRYETLKRLYTSLGVAELFPDINPVLDLLGRTAESAYNP